MNYTLHQLQVYLKVVQLRSITQAAGELYMSQPAASIQLKNFQQQFDLPLTEVVGRQLYVTDFGQEVATLAERVLREAEAIRYKMQDYQGLITGKLKIASASTGKYVIPYFISGFLKAHPGIDLMLDVTNRTRVIDSLKNNKVDFAVVSVLPEEVEVLSEVLLDNKLYLIGDVPEYQPDRPLIYREKGSATRTAMETYFRHLQNPHKRIELTTNEAVKQAILAGLGYSVLPVIGIRHELLSRQLHLIPQPGLPILTKWRLVWRKDRQLSPVAQAYCSYLREAKDHIVENCFRWCANFQ